ncbi:translocation/assembly module TamB [Vibrio sp. JC009]|uniref:autotransporter assembly complex protein TamB n=1 Tax=Vibrio sp. JC009 TaxID=2912314 RepID=UPI0023B0EDB2|nr:translocation/assembly module TamB domain-containing protein [Vibrio sp. JC009]WED22126.1 translocation/assembly module TamB [Vibrio sp. JC009]
MSRVALKWLKRIALSLFVLAGLLIALISGVLFTNTGLSLVLWGAEKALPQLSVEQGEGAILPGFTLHNTSFSDDSLSVDLTAKALAIAVNPACFLSSSVCVEQLALDGVDFRLGEQKSPSEIAEDNSSQAATDFRFPFPLQINGVELNDIALDILGNRVAWKHFSTAVGMSGNSLIVYKTELKNIQLALAPADSKADKQTASQNAPSAIKLPEIEIPLQVIVKRFDITDFSLQGDTPVVVNHLGLEASAEKHNVSIKSLNLDTPQAGLTLESDITLTGGYPLKLKAEAKVKQTELKGESLTLEASGSVEKLKLNADLSGPVKAVLQGSLESLNSQLPFDMAVKKGALRWPLTGSADYKAAIDALQLSGSLQGYRLNLDAAITGKDIPAMQLVTAGEGDLNSIKLETIKLDTLGGEISGSVKAGWEAPVNWQATLGMSDIQPGQEWQEMQGSISGALTTTGQLLESGGWEVQLPVLDIEGRVREYPLDIEGNINIADLKGSGDIRLDTRGLSVKHGVNGIFVSGNLDKEWNMDARIDIPAIQKSVPDLQGKLLGDVTVRGQMKQPQVRANITASDMAYAPVGKVATAELAADISPLPTPKGTLTLFVKDAESQGQVIDSADLSFSGDQTKHELSLSLLSKLINASLYVSGSFEDKPAPVWQGTLEKADFKTEQGSWSINHPVDLAFSVREQMAKIQAHCWSQAESNVCLTKDTRAGKSGEAELAVTNFDFSQIAMFIPKALSLTGKLDATGHAKWAPETSPDVSVSIQLPEGKVVQNSDRLTLGWDAVRLNASLRDDELKADWLVHLTDNGRIYGDADIADIQASGRSLDGSLNIEALSLDMFEPVLGEYSHLEALIDSRLKFAGPVEHPEVYGELAVHDMVVLGEITPLEVKKGNISLLFNGYDASLDADIESSDGLLQVDGSAGWQDLKAWHTNVRVHSDELNVNLPPMVKVKVKPDMAISVTPELAKIEGDIHLPWGRILVEELPEEAVNVSSDEVVLNSKLQPEQESAPLPMLLESNVNIHVGNDFTLSAFGLKGNLKGQLNVSQKDKGPFITGEINIQDGTYRSFGQDLIISKGKILMNGPADQPYLQVTAVRNPDNTQDDVTAGIKVTGPANEPEIEIFSDPAMPQQNALSYLLRGQDIDGESGGSAMTTALIGLSLAKSGRIVGEIGEAFGVSDLQLDTAGSGEESQVTVSGYILPGLQVKYGVGIFDSFGEFTVRYRLLEDLYLEAVSGMDSAVDLLYQFEFD